MHRVVVRIFHRPPGPAAGPLERLLGEARAALAERQVGLFLAAGADDASIIAGSSEDVPFGARLRQLVRAERPTGLVVLGSGAVPLATREDLVALVQSARRETPYALANNRYSADVLAVACAERLAELPDLPSDNALPRWLEEIAGYAVADLRRRWRLGVDLDSPLDLVLTGTRRWPDGEVVEERLGRIAAVAADRRAQIVVTGRTSAAAVGWLERGVDARTRILIEERGLRAGTSLARSDGGRTPAPRSVLGAILDRDGPASLGDRLAELGDAALVDTRVLLAHRLGADERSWPSAEDRFASDLLLADRVSDPWLRALTEAAAAAPIPIVLGGHTLVGPGIRLALRRRRREQR